MFTYPHFYIKVTLMKKINDILTNYFSLNLLSILGNLSLFIVIFYFFILYPIETSYLPKGIDSFDVLYGIVMELIKLFEYISSLYFILLAGILIELIIQKFIKYQVFKLVQNKIYITFFYLGLLISIILIIIFINCY